MGTTVGVLTIGQSPRPDGLGRDVQDILGNSVTVVERGALDGLSREQIDAMRPSDSDYRLITLLNDNTSVVIAKQPILDLLQQQITELETSHGVSGTLLMCTGEFPSFRHQKPLIRPQASLYGVVIGIAGGDRIGALTPLEAQIPQAREKWKSMGVSDPALAFADPYCDDPVAAVRDAAADVNAQGASVLFMDCFGYDLRMRDAAREAFHGPVVLARSMAARIVSEAVV